MNNFRKLLLISASLLITPAAFAQGNCSILSYQNLDTSECKILKIENLLSGFSGKDRGIYRPNDLAVKRSERITILRPELASAPAETPAPGTATSPAAASSPVVFGPASAPAPDTASAPGTVTGPIATGPVAVVVPPTTAPAATTSYEIVTAPAKRVVRTYTIEGSTQTVVDPSTRIVSYEISPRAPAVSSDDIMVAYLRAEDAKTIYFSSYEIIASNSKDHPAAERSLVEISVDSQPAGNNPGNNPGGPNNPGNDNPGNDNNDNPGGPELQN